MNGKILVTDSLFIFDEHVKKLEDAGYQVERLDKPSATEEELCEAIKGKIGYILGGIENVTKKVIESADELKAIAFTGTDWQVFIPGWEVAAAKGIKIVNAPAANAFAVAEFAMAVALSMQRNLFELGRTGDKKFETTKSLKGSIVGIIGAGNIGSKIIHSVQAFHPSKTLYYSRTRKDNLGAEYVEFNELLGQSDIVFVAVPKSAGTLLDEEQYKNMKPGSLLVSISAENMNFESLLPYLQSGKLRVAIDWPSPSIEFEQLPLGTWFNTNDHTAYNTYEANKTGSDMAIESLLNLLSKGTDQYLVN